MWRALLLLAVAAVDAGGLRLKFAFTAVRNSGHSSQAVDISLSELVVRDADLNVLTVAFISGHHNAEHPKGEGPAALIDGDNATKWIDLNFAQNGDEAYLIVEMQEGQLEPAAFELFTNLQGQSRRDPVDFAVYKENDCLGWDVATKPEDDSDARWSGLIPPEERGVSYDAASPFRFTLPALSSMDSTRCEYSDRYRFLISKVRGPDGVDGVQLGELKISGDTYDAATGVTSSGPLHIAQISNPGGCGGTLEAEQCGMKNDTQDNSLTLAFTTVPFTTYSQLVDKLVDGDVDFDPNGNDPLEAKCKGCSYKCCKWFDSSFDPEGSASGHSMLEVRLTGLSLLTRYELYTAADVEKRDPVSWTVQKMRQDGVTWQTIAQVDDNPTPMARRESYGSFYAHGPPPTPPPPTLPPAPKRRPRRPRHHPCRR